MDAGKCVYRKAVWLDIFIKVVHYGYQKSTVTNDLSTGRSSSVQIHCNKYHWDLSPRAKTVVPRQISDILFLSIARTSNPKGKKKNGAKRPAHFDYALKVG